MDLRWGQEEGIYDICWKTERLESRSNGACVVLFLSEELQYSLCVWRQRYKDPGSGFMRSGPPAWSQMKPNTSSVSSTRPENQAPHVYGYKGHHTDSKAVSMLQPKYLSHGQTASATPFPKLVFRVGIQWTASDHFCYFAKPTI